ncbi:isopentenyl-diphosphate Delta-isomerase [Leucobacter luti]|uniref:Isopentenyl-diphosphate Delta-isomerase n=1 Tax=Leucobacter luti TaxID=340320 RepID=A0A4R6RSH2_9MICO|nr:isopentenyl-diphosphate Delta-isomerase [Leucobacter luti]MCW2289930.1 isopentenyl-diphosphate delta-isomerase [Leucobacter luti]QYM76933.1 isopentenyl-diphosphate Delta-isomerase [Leucobacter luti]TCK36099.1 isopentenyl-diphosphate delta-isomerase [Leucobacter luti]TDP89801.1 isopentenyl-diphosphate delta-isomerase [Leucobacter luti]
MTTHPELVVLMSAEGEAVGTAEKSRVHSADTPLHLAFSCYLTDSAGRVLLTRRALSKQAWPGVWTNSFCGHPAPGESFERALTRRAHQELGVELDELNSALPDFRYRAVDSAGTVENEICPVFTARVRGDLAPEASEVAEWAWVAPGDLAVALAATPFVFSPWLREQLPLLTARGALDRMVTA